MPNRDASRSSMTLFAAVLATGLVAAPAMAAPMQTFITGFTKNNNIYTDLNQQYPNTGPGVPGSHTGTPNGTFLYDPYSYAMTTGVPGSNLVGNNGVDFQLTANATGQDFAQIGNPGGGPYTGPNPLVVPIGVTGVMSVHALMTSYVGQSFSVTFTGANSATQTFSNLSLPDFNGGGAVNSCSGGACVQTVFQVQDTGAGGTGNSSNGAFNTYNLVEVSFTLGAALSSQVLSTATFTSNGYETLLLGLTTLSPAVTGPVGVPEPASMVLLGGGVMGLGLIRRRRGRATG